MHKIGGIKKDSAYGIQFVLDLDWLKSLQPVSSK